MQDQFSRTRLLIGEEGLDRLRRARVAVFGIGGVGGYVCEALIRGGVGALDLTDNDRVCLSNLNRQIIATRGTVGRLKTEVMAERIRDINPDAKVEIRNCFVLPENVGDFPFEAYDYVVDAVDTVAAKLALIQRAAETGTPVISCMGTGNKLDPGKLRVADISETRVCPLARVMRRELKRRGIEKLKVVYSEEEPLRPAGTPEIPDEPDVQGPGETEGERTRRSVPGSVSFVPPAAGLLIAAEVIRDLIGK